MEAGRLTPDVASRSDGWVATLQRDVLRWYGGVARDLPWRRTRDPWSVLVSETMLQQTQVARVIPKYHAFLERFPDVASCANAPAADVIRLWQGLGYNRRALGLRDAACAVERDHAGAFPCTYEALTALPGVGPYTARAVLVFAFEQHHAVVDTNVGRILARAVHGRPLTRFEVQAGADELVPDGDAWQWNQALLDLGATVCTKRSPHCDACPIASMCCWQSTGGDDPATGSAAVSVRQSAFVGSDRQGRGRMIDTLRERPVFRDEVAIVMGWPDDVERADRVLESLVKHRLVVVENDVVQLPQ